MNAEFGRVAHNKWLEERKQQERDTSKVNVFFGELRWRDFISRAILGDYYFFLSDNALASVDDQAFSCLATQLSYIALTVVGGFMAYIGYLVDVGVDDA